MLVLREANIKGVSAVRLKFLIRALVFSVVVLMLASSTASSVLAQEEGEPKVIDEVIAQVNNDVITLSMLKREMKERTEDLKQRGEPEQQASEKVERQRPEIIAELINEQLLLQKGKDNSQISEQVEQEVNKRLLEIGKQQGITTIEALDQAMRDNKIDPAAFRQRMRTEMMKGMVLNREVDAKIFFSLSTDEVKKHYEANRDKFRPQESITLSEIFLSKAGKSEQDVRAKASDIVARARGGADFAELAVTNSEREGAAQSKGKLGRFLASDISREDVAAAIKNLKAGAVTDPIPIDEGFLILRVDERTAPGAGSFNENQVREAIAMERAGGERKKYLQSLLEDAFVKINDEYRPAVEPLLERKPEKAPGKSATPAEKKTGAEKKSDTNTKQQP